MCRASMTERTETKFQVQVMTFIMQNIPSLLLLLNLQSPPPHTHSSCIPHTPSFFLLSLFLSNNRMSAFDLPGEEQMLFCSKSSCSLHLSLVSDYWWNGERWHLYFGPGSELIVKEPTAPIGNRKIAAKWNKIGKPVLPSWWEPDEDTTTVPLIERQFMWNSNAVKLRNLGLCATGWPSLSTREGWGSLEEVQARACVSVIICVVTKKIKLCDCVFPLVCILRDTV